MLCQLHENLIHSLALGRVLAVFATETDPTDCTGNLKSHSDYQMLEFQII